jgi:hypothetical protein
MAQTIGTDTRKTLKLIPELTKKVAEHDQELKDKHRVMFGNGDGTVIGWDEQLRTIQKWIDLQIEKEKKRIAWWDKFQWVIIPMIVSGFAVFIWQALYFYFTVVPRLSP